MTFKRCVTVNLMILIGILCSFLVVADDTCSSLPIPKTPYGNAVVLAGENSQDAVTIEVYWDLLCPDSRAQSKSIAQVMSHYGLDKVNIIIHPYPLPYHRNGFMASWASYIVRSLRPENGNKAQYDFIMEAFSKQEALYNVNAENVTWSQAQQMLAGWAQESVNVSKSEFLARFVCNFKTCDNSYDLANTAFKYGAAHGAAATPTTLLNGQALVVDTSSWDLAAWKIVLDPLVFPNRRV